MPTLKERGYKKKRLFLEKDCFDWASKRAKEEGLCLSAFIEKLIKEKLG